MSATTSIEWTDKSWNPVRGCSVVSPGCVNCYAMKQAHRFNGGWAAGLTKQTKAGPQWTGKVVTVESALLEPLSWRKPQRVFVNSMSDLFHEDVPFEFVHRVFGVMALAKHHTFQILTKRADRMRQYFATVATRHLWASAAKDLPGGKADGWREKCDDGVCNGPFPLPNVWLGVSVEDQQRADERIPLLLQTPAAVRFLSCEPLLGPVKLENKWGDSYLSCTSKLTNEQYEAMTPAEQMKVGGCCEAFDTGGEPHYHGIDWVIVGGESGPGARPFDVAWARSIVQQCEAAGVACFVKQIGTNPLDMERSELIDTEDRKGGDPTEWPADIRVREFPTVRS